MSIVQQVSTLYLKDSVTFTLNTEFLNHNFSIVKQCLLRIKDLEANIGKSKQNTSHIEKQLSEISGKIDKNSQDINYNDQRIKELNNNVGDQFMKKMYAIEEKTKNMYDFNETVRRLEDLEKFVTVDTFHDSTIKTEKQIQKVWKLKEELDRYMLKTAFEQYREDHQSCLIAKQKRIDEVNNQIKVLEQIVNKLSDTVGRFDDELKQNNAMIKEINFTEMLDKIKKFKEQTQHRVVELASKMKKKVSTGQLLALEKTIIEKLDKFFGQNEKSKAEKLETKQALLFLEKKINQIQSVVISKMSEQDKDALFSVKKWQCASCTKDLGKYEGKLGQYKPWSIFPCKELDPEKTGGFGYLNYIDKMSYKKGYEIEDQSMDRVNKTFYDTKQKDSPKKQSTARPSNIISNYGSEQRSSSLKDAYFRDIRSEKGDRNGTNNKLFRVSKKQLVKPVGEQELRQALQNN